MTDKKRELKNLLLKASGGVDLTSEPTDVMPGRASYIRNLFSDGVGCRKRRGFHQILKFTDKNGAPLKINGIHSYISDNGEQIIIHAGCGFYRENGEKISSSVEITDTPSSAFQLRGALYIIGCGGLYVYDGESLKSASPYIPKTYSGYDSNFESDSLCEGKNLMSALSIAEYCGKNPPEVETPIFRFPENISDSHNATVTVTVSPVTNQIYLCAGEAPDPDNDVRINCSVEAIFKLHPKESLHGLSVSCEEISLNGCSVYILDPISTTEHIITPKIFLSAGGKSFSFNFNTQSEFPDDMSIRLDYMVREAELSPIDGCTIGEIIQDSRGRSRLVLSGNPNYPNRIFFSDVLDNKEGIYFPEECALSVDTDSPVTALMKLSDTYLGVFKRDRLFRYTFSYSPEADSPAERHVISGYEGRDTVGSVSSRACGRQGNDLLVFNGDGVYGIDSVSSQTDRELLSERSRNIRRALLSHSTEESMSAVACMLEGKYYLFLGGKVYIADTSRDFSDKSLSKSRQYEWWVWDGISILCAKVIGRKMYLGDTLGGIFIMGDDFRDIRIHRAAAEGDALYDEADGLFTLNPSMLTDEPHFARLMGECSFLEKGEFSAFIHTSLGKTRTVILPSVQSQRACADTALCVVTASGDKLPCRYTLFGDDEELGIFSLTDNNGELLSVPPEEIYSIRILDDGKKELYPKALWQ